MVQFYSGILPFYHPQPLYFKGNDTRTYDELREPTQKGHASGRYRITSWRYRIGRRRPDTHLLEAIKAFVPSGGRVLEIGFNMGGALLALAKQGYQVFGVEIDDGFNRHINQQAKKMKVKDRVHTVLWDFGESGNLPPEWQDLPEEAFHAIYAVHVMSHFGKDDLITMIQGLQKHLAPGGVLIITIIDPLVTTDKKLLKRDIIEQHKHKAYSLAHAGYESHSQAVLDAAFQDLQPVKSLSRHFKRKELQGWGLPEDRVRWVVYQKPKTDRK